MSSDNGSTPSTPPVAPPPTAAPPPAQSSNLLLAALGYPIPILALVTVLVEKTDPEVKFHGWNGLFWGLALLALGVAFSILGMIPGVGILALLLWPLYPVWLVFAIIFAVKANNRQPVNIPVISDLARKQAGIS